MARTPQHGDWIVEDQSRTDNGFQLMRYCGVLPRKGWHFFGFYESYTAATMARAKFVDPDVDNDGTPWPTKV